MPVLGLLLGRRVSDALGSHAHLIGGALLVATGAFTVAQALRPIDRSPSTFDLRRGRLWLLAASLTSTT